MKAEGPRQNRVPGQVLKQQLTVQPVAQPVLLLTHTLC